MTNPETYQEYMRDAGEDVAGDNPAEVAEEAAEGLESVFGNISEVVSEVVESLQSILNEFLRNFGFDIEAPGLAPFNVDMDITLARNINGVMEASIMAVSGATIVIGVDENGDGLVDDQEVERYLDANPRAREEYRRARVERVGSIQDALQETYDTNVALRNQEQVRDQIIRNGRLDIGEAITPSGRTTEITPHLKPRVGRNVYTSGLPGRIREDRDGDGDTDTFSTQERVAVNIIDMYQRFGVVRWFSLDHDQEMADGIRLAEEELHINIEHAHGAIRGGRGNAERNRSLLASALDFYLQGDCVFHCSWGCHRAVTTFACCQLLADTGLASRITDEDRHEAEISGRSPEFIRIAKENNIEYLDDFDSSGEIAMLEMFDDLAGNTRLQNEIRRSAGMRASFEV